MNVNNSNEIYGVLCVLCVRRPILDVHPFFQSSFFSHFVLSIRVIFFFCSFSFYLFITHTNCYLCDTICIHLYSVEELGPEPDLHNIAITITISLHQHNTIEPFSQYCVYKASHHPKETAMLMLQLLLMMMMTIVIMWTKAIFFLVASDTLSLYFVGSVCSAIISIFVCECLHTIFAMSFANATI